jgi:hypothetical protein
LLRTALFSLNRVLSSPQFLLFNMTGWLLSELLGLKKREGARHETRHLDEC